MTVGRGGGRYHGEWLHERGRESTIVSPTPRRSGGALRNRPGVSLVELLVVLTLTGVLGTITMTTFVGVQRYVRRHADRVAGAEARRVASAVLAAELRYLDPMTDIYGLGPDSVALRAFRGVAVVCDATTGSVLVRYRGLRAPEPAKDSLTMVGLSPSPGDMGTTQSPGTGGASAAGALVASSAISSGCELQAGESLYRWTLDPVPPLGALLLLFESGSYHLNGGALRYRRGEAGRQPLTAELLDDRAAALQWVAVGGAGSGAGTTGAGPLTGVAIVLATKPKGAGKASTPQGTRSWIRLQNGGQW